MSDFLDHRLFWLVTALIVFVGMQIFSFKTEVAYGTKYSQSISSRTETWIQAGVSFLAFLIFVWLLKERHPAAVLPALAGLFAILKGVYVIDKNFLMIPDRLQIAGAFTGLLFVLVQIASGESWRELSLSLAFGGLMVVFLWILSVAYFRLRGSIGFGFGDVKLLGWMTFFVGSKMSDLILYSIASGLIYLFGSALLKSFKNKKLSLPGAQDAFAFGPSIVIGFFLEEIFRYI